MVDGNPTPFHAREHRHQWPLQSLVDAGDMLACQARFEHMPQPQRDIGVLGGILRRPFHRHAIEAELGFSRTRDLVVIDGGVIEITLRERVEPVV